MNKSESIIELSKALARFQGEVENPKNTAVNPFFKSKYAPLETVLNTTRPILAKNGLSIIQAPSSEGEYVSITTTLLHESGEWIEFAPLNLKTDKNTAQGAGSAITYARRYAISAILGIASEEDDDGNIAEPKDDKTNKAPNTANNSGHNNEKSTKTTLSEAQVKRLYAIAGSKGVDANTVKALVIQKLKKEVTDLTREEYNTICKAYENMKAKEE